MRISPQAYRTQLELKQQRIEALLAPLGIPVLEVHPSAPEHYRMRAEFRVWHEGQDCYFVMFKPGDGSSHYRVDQFLPASRRINALMRSLRDALLASDVLRHWLYQVEFLTTLSGEALITLIYRRPLDEAWTGAATALETLLNARIIGRSRKQRIVISNDYVTEAISVGGRQLVYRQPEGSFVQPNGEMNRMMLGWAADCCAEPGGDLLELYCGLGNFTVAIAPHFRQVLATEINKTAIAAAAHNLAANGISNTTVARLSAAEAAQALSGERPFRRLATVDLSAFQPETLLVDPPRAGLDDFSRNFSRGFARIVYISCNPETLERDLRALKDLFAVSRLALFDQFPMTPHIETGVLLSRR